MDPSGSVLPSVKLQLSSVQLAVNIALGGVSLAGGF
jgi:hypothetical protein